MRERDLPSTIGNKFSVCVIPPLIEHFTVSNLTLTITLTLILTLASTLT
jgi:hypothetical protein